MGFDMPDKVHSDSRGYDASTTYTLGTHTDKGRNSYLPDPSPQHTVGTPRPHHYPHPLLQLIYFYIEGLSTGCVENFSCGTLVLFFLRYNTQKYELLSNTPDYYRTHNLLGVYESTFFALVFKGPISPQRVAIATRWGLPMVGLL